MAVTLAKLLNPRFYIFRAQRKLRRPQVRDRIGAWVSRARQDKAFADHILPALAGRLREDGFAWLGPALTDGQVEAARDFLQTKPVRNFYRPNDAAFLPLGEGRNPISHVANHAITDVLAAPHLLLLANRLDVLALVEEHLGCKPTITSLSAWWSYPTPTGPQHAELFHRDIDDWRFVKLFVYLTDVNEDQGPHVYVRNSAHSASLWRAERYSDEEVHAEFGADNRLDLVAPAGSAFLENTTGLHKGTPVRAGTRLLFQAVYGLSPLPDTPRVRAAHRRDIERLHGQALDPYVNRYLLD